MQFTPMLTPLHRAPIPKEILGFDCETVGNTNDFILGVVSTQEADYSFRDAQALLDFLCQRKYRKARAYATNLHFDFFALSQAIAGPGKILAGWEIFDNGAKIICARKTARERKGRSEYVTLADTMNLFPPGSPGASVEGMGKILAQAGIPEVKLTKPSFLGRLPKTESEWQTLETYCAADARVTRRFTEWFQTEANALGAELKLTAASTAMNLFRRKHLQAVIPQPTLPALIDAKLSYYGGRTEDFVKGLVSPIIDHDVTAMYPSSMVSTEYPYPSPETTIRVTKPEREILQQEGVACVTISVPEMHIPPLPYRSPEGKLLFPTGTLKGVWTNLELRYAQLLGCEIKEIAWAYGAPTTFNPFRSYVESLWRKREYYLCPDNCGALQSGAKCPNALVTEEVIKLFLNGLYGKFGQNFLSEKDAAKVGLTAKKQGGIFKSIEEASPEEMETTAETLPHYLAQGFVIEPIEAKLRPFMNPILSSYTTAAARIRLHAMMQKAHREAVVYYTDTDSILTNRPLSFSTKRKALGELQLGKSYSTGIILGPKAKELHGERDVYTFKGLPANSFMRTQTTQRNIPVTPRKTAFRALKSGRVKASFSRFLKFREALNRGLRPNEIVAVHKTFNPLKDTKRRILGKPTLRALTERSFETEAWSV